MVTMLGRLAFFSLIVPTVLAAQSEGSLRLQGGMANADDPLNVTVAWGGAGALHFGRVALLVSGLHQNRKTDSGGGLRTNGRNLWGMALEYSGAGHGLYRRQALAQIGAGGVARGPYRTAWYLTGGVGLRYPVAQQVAFVGRINDYAVFLPDEPRHCTPTGTPNCTDTVVKQVQHNYAFIVSFELVL